LRELADDFDIEGIERMLEAFPEMVKTIDCPSFSLDSYFGVQDLSWNNERSQK